jgi:hypothetical protein
MKKERVTTDELFKRFDFDFITKNRYQQVFGESKKVYPDIPSNTVGKQYVSLDQFFIVTDFEGVPWENCLRENPNLSYPTHEEIMTKWWFNKDEDIWFRVLQFIPYKHYCYKVTKNISYCKSAFKILKSADIPPEGVPNENN